MTRLTAAATPADQRKLASLQAALEAEEAAIYGYGVAGSHLTGALYDQAFADSVVHERTRDSLTRMIIALGGQIHPAAAAYQLPISVRTAASAVALAALLEQQVAAAYLGLVAVADPALRTFAANRMQGAAARAARWSGHSQPFPGLPPGR